MRFTASKLNDFTKEVLKIRDYATHSLSKKDYHHLKKIIWVNRLLLSIGFGTAWLIPNPVSMLAIGIALSGMWTIVAHHVLHGGYDQLQKIPKRYHSNSFARGFYRMIDWPDWIYPPAWKYEHNKLHHFFVNEIIDPDQMSYRLAAKTSTLSNHKPKWIKIIQISIKISFWKCSYYAFNTMKAYAEKKTYKQDGDFSKYRRATYRHCIIPYISTHFVVLPLLFLPLGWQACLFVLINRCGAELITNWHTFFIIVTNHTGADLALQQTHFRNKGEFYLAQVLSSCNFNTGGFWRDYLHGYLNYQIEHHFFPNLPASQYAKIQPLVKALCGKYKIPYVQESLLQRSKKLLNIMLQKEVMPFSSFELITDCKERLK
ncbi:MAG: hypothetical protein A3F46_08310 [Legionellales bacterium RIFCSPHIGHO2_12_FULL_42_9]|nr:MAG: hypothetical protein A3F46_08310 [Legionellales bacterium RIFCSPHIGHO2_12_FULL_42_9]